MIGFDPSDNPYGLECKKMGFIVCSKCPLRVTRIHVSNPGPEGPLVYTCSVLGSMCNIGARIWLDTGSCGSRMFCPTQRGSKFDLLFCFFS